MMALHFVYIFSHGGNWNQQEVCLIDVKSSTLKCSIDTLVQSIASGTLKNPSKLGGRLLNVMIGYV